jgi:mono/diheme cytochrome c family protein
MSRLFARVALLVALVPTWCAAQEAPPDFSKAGLAFLKQHCLECHSGDKPKAELSLAGFIDNGSVVKKRKTWESVLKMVESGEMPPDDKPQPTAKEIEDFASLARAVFDHHDKHAKPDPGRVTMRRLNRVEYANTLRDLVGADFNPAADFPSDDIGHGFDNIGDVLTLSPVLMEQYLAAAETVSQRVILANPPRPASRYLSGRYLQPNNAQTPQGRFRPMNPADAEPVNSGPFAAPGDYLKFTADADLILRANMYAETNGTSPVKVALFISGGKLADPSPDEEVDQLMGAALKGMKPLKILKVFEITGRDAKSVQQIEFPINRRGDIQRAGLAIVKPPEGEEPPKLFIEHIWSEGPLETRPASHLMLLKCTPDKPQAEQTREVLSRLLSRGYRRTATPQEVEAMAKVVDQAVAGGEKWESGMQWAVQALLCSPKFLFRVELDDRPDSPEARSIDEFHLASRLSYFLWNTMPDDELFDLARRGELSKNLDSQVQRMLKDSRAVDSLVDQFAMQWLQLKRLDSFAPDAKLFPDFNEGLRRAMRDETRLFLEAIVKEDRSLLELLAADFTFLNEPLARHYGIADTNGNLVGQKPAKDKGQPIRGPQFVRVNVTGTTRGGLLTQASLLTVTSNPTRTSPVKRGRWVLEQLLGTPPPPPPPNVPELEQGEKLTGSLRQRMEQHRANPSCASCHARMDPLGFAFENFDAIGRFRDKDGEFAIDPAGELPTGEKFAGPNELKEVLKTRQNLFARCITEKLLTYALGRGLEYYDRPAVDRITTAMGQNGYRFSTLIIEIVKSEPFRMRRGLTAEDKN